MDAILIVEDEPHIADTVRLALEREGLGPVFIAEDLSRAREILSRVDEVAAAIIDIGLPDGSGLDLSVQMRSTGSQALIMFLTARNTEVDKLAGFGVGGDDYITKPFSPLELAARIRAFVKRTHATDATDEILVLGKIKIGLHSGTVEIDGIPVEMPALEFKLLKFLAENRGVAFTTAEIYERVWAAAPIGHGDENNVRVHIRRLRQRIEADPSRPEIIVTVRGLGYRFDERAVGSSSEGTDASSRNRI